MIGVARNGPASGLRDAGANLVVFDLRELTTAACCPRGEDLQTPSSALEHSDRIAMRLKEREPALFLDYDEKPEELSDE